MYCILVTGIPASGKSTIAETLSRRLDIPVVSKDRIKELMYDGIGFNSRKEKVALGVTSMEIMYYFVEQLMKCGEPFILENNFENISREGLLAILDKYSYTAITVLLTGDYRTVYERFVERNESPSRHRGHVVNDCYPEREGACSQRATITYEDYTAGIEERGMADFRANGPCIVLDTSDFTKVNMEAFIEEILTYINQQKESN